MKSSLQVHSRRFLQVGGIGLLIAAAWQLIWLYQSMHTWQELNGLIITTFAALFLGTFCSRSPVKQPKWVLGLFFGLLLVAYLISIHQVQDSRLMIGLIISLLILLILIVD